MYLKKSSITSGDSNKSTVLDTIELNVFKDSPFLGAIGNTPISSKYTYKPYVTVPDVADTSFLIGELKLTRDLLNASATLTDETEEDSSVGISEPLQGIVEYQLRSKLEAAVVAKLKTTISTTAVNGTTVFDAARELLKTISTEASTVKGKLVLCISHDSYIDLVVSAPSAAKALSNLVTITATSALADNDVVLMHSHGSAIGYSITSLELSRNAGSQSTTYFAQGYSASAFSPEYVVRAEI